MRTFFEAIIGVFSITAIIMIIIVFFFGKNASPADDSPVSNDQAAIYQTDAPTTQTQVLSTSSDIEQVKANLASIFLSLNIDASDVSVSEIDTQGTRYRLSYTLNESVWNASDLLAKVFSYYIRFCKIAYTQGDYVIVVMQTNYSLRDDKGNTYVDQAVRTGMYRDVFLSYNWDAFSYLPIYDIMKKDCYDFWVLPGIMQDINTDDVYYISE